LKKTLNTGFWTFFCNPKYWSIDDFLPKIQTGFESQYRIASWQKEDFKKGDLGLIRVGHDGRSKRQLNGLKKLERGVYAIVEITGLPYVQRDSNFVIRHQKEENGRFVVPIKYIRNYIKSPILLSLIENDIIIKRDPYLLKGMQAASMPLLEETFNRILMYGEENSSIEW
jgi:hypothetical protein